MVETFNKTVNAHPCSKLATRWDDRTRRRRRGTRRRRWRWLGCACTIYPRDQDGNAVGRHKYFHRKFLFFIFVARFIYSLCDLIHPHFSSLTYLREKPVQFLFHSGYEIVMPYVFRVMIFLRSLGDPFLSVIKVVSSSFWLLRSNDSRHLRISEYWAWTIEQKGCLHQKEKNWPMLYFFNIFDKFYKIHFTKLS